MKKIVLALLFLPWVCFAGGAVGNGGDSIECIRSEKSPYVGVYNLDYLANVIAGSSFAGDFAKAVPAGASFDTQMLRVIAASEKVSPTFSRALHTYRESLFQNSLTAPYSWKMAPYGLNEVDDENLNINLPENCLRNGHAKPYLQTVIRNQMQHQVQLTLYQTAYEKLDSLQKSFLLFHEWLWSFTQDPEVVRNANAVLHSDQWDEAHANEKLALLYLAGFDFKAMGMTAGEIEIRINDQGLGCSGSGYCLPRGSRYEINQSSNADAIVLSFENQTTDKDAYFMPATTLQDSAKSTFRKIARDGAKTSTMLEWLRNPGDRRFCVILAEKGAPAPVPSFTDAKNIPKDVVICPLETQLTVYFLR